MKKPKSIVQSPKKKERGSTAMPDEDSIEVRFKQFAPKPALEIDSDSQKPQKTRTEHFRELEERRLQNLEEVFTPADFKSRFVAALIDLALCLIGGHLLLKNIPQLNFKFYALPLKNTLLSWYVAYVLVALIVHVLPLHLFQQTLGKKIMKIRVRGSVMYSLNLFQVFFRELIAKPLSIALFVGVYYAITSKNHIGLHDKISRTRVIVS